MARDKRDAKKLKLLKQLEDNPLVSLACNRAGISRATYYRWRDEDPVFRGEVLKAIAKGTDKLNDFAESKLIENIKAGNQQAIAYWLRFNHRAYRPQALRLVIEENNQQRIELKKMQQMLEELINVVGEDKLIEAAVPDPKAFKEKLQKEVEEHRKHTDEL
jgi:hypothetical protein